MNDSEQILDEIIGTFIALKFDIDVDDFKDGTLERWNNMKAAILQHYVSKEEVERLLKVDEEVNLELHGRPDCKSCSFAEMLRENLGLDGGEEHYSEEA